MSTLDELDIINDISLTYDVEFSPETTITQLKNHCITLNNDINKLKAQKAKLEAELAQNINNTQDVRRVMYIQTISSH